MKKMLVLLSIMSNFAFAESHTIDFQIKNDKYNGYDFVIFQRPIEINDTVSTAWKVIQSPSLKDFHIDYSLDYSVTFPETKDSNKINPEHILLGHSYTFENGVFKIADSNDVNAASIVNNSDHPISFTVSNDGHSVYQVKNLEAHHSINLNNHPVYQIGLVKNATEGMVLTKEHLKTVSESIDFSKGHKFTIEIIDGVVHVKPVQ